MLITNRFSSKGVEIKGTFEERAKRVFLTTQDGRTWEIVERKQGISLRALGNRRDRKDDNAIIVNPQASNTIFVTSVDPETLR